VTTTHILYLDDSGTKEYAAKPSQYGGGVTRYFVFGGVLITVAEASVITPTLRELKRRTFGTDDVEIKSNWLRMPEERSERYLQLYGVSNKDLNRFVEEYYTAIQQSELLLLAGVVDKRDMQEDYKTPYYPPAIAYEIVLQRVQRELGEDGAVYVTTDDTTGATPKGNQYKDNLKRQHEYLKKKGSRLWDGFTFPAIKGRLRFVDSASSELIQVADIAAYNVYRQFVDHGDAWEKKGLGSLPMYDYFRKLLGKFRQDPEGRIQGYGVVKFPLRKRVRWSLIRRKK
jgi:hypothetical protein